MKKIYHFLMAFFLFIALSMGVSFVVGNHAYAIQDVDISGETGDDSSTETFISNGGFISLNTESLLEDTDQFLHILLKRKVGDDWVTVYEQEDELGDSPLIFDEEIMPGVEYRFDFTLDEDEVQNVSYQIEQSAPSESSEDDPFDDLKPEFNVKHQMIIYKVMLKNQLVDVKGNLSYRYGDQQNVSYIDHQNAENDEEKQIPLLDFDKTYWPKEAIYNANGEEHAKGNKSTIDVTFIGNQSKEVLEQAVDEEIEAEKEELKQSMPTRSSTLHFSRRLAKLKVDQQVKKDQVTVTASSPIKVPKKLKSKWKFELVDKDSEAVLKTEEKEVDSDKLHASHTFKKADFKEKKNTQIVVSFERVDFTPGKADQDEILLTRGEGIADAKHIQAEEEKKESPVKESDKSQVKNKADEKEGEDQVTSPSSTEENEEELDDETEIDPIDKIDTERQEPEPETQEPETKKEKIEAGMKLSSSILADHQVEVKAVLEGADAPKGIWTFIYNGEAPQTVEGQGEQIKKSFPTQGTSEKEVPVTIKFVGKDKNNHEVFAEKTEKITVKNEVKAPELKETVAEEDLVVAEIIKTNANLNGQVGGKLPKTANNYGNGLLIGVFFLLIGAWFLYRRNRIQ